MSCAGREGDETRGGRHDVCCLADPVCCIICARLFGFCNGFCDFCLVGVFGSSVVSLGWKRSAICCHVEIWKFTRGNSPTYTSRGGVAIRVAVLLCQKKPGWRCFFLSSFSPSFASLEICWPLITDSFLPLLSGRDKGKGGAPPCVTLPCP